MYMDQLAHMTDRPFLTGYTRRLNCLRVVAKICGVGCANRHKNGRKESGSKKSYMERNSTGLIMPYKLYERMQKDSPLDGKHASFG